METPGIALRAGLRNVKLEEPGFRVYGAGPAKAGTPNKIEPPGGIRYF
jgi:hypothetical protein